MLANLSTNRFLKYWRKTGRRVPRPSAMPTASSLSRGRAADATASTKLVITKLGPTLNEVKTKDARAEHFDFLGYAFARTIAATELSVNQRHPPQSLRAPACQLLMRRPTN
jgi:hypothetical protein